MSILKGLLIIVTMLVGGSSLAMALNGPPTGHQPPVAGSATANPAALQHLAQRGGIGRSGAASNTQAYTHGNKGRYKSGQ
jgi:hypothetical protein